MSEREAIVRWLRDRQVTPASIFTLRDRLFYAWWGFRNPGVSMMAARVAAADSIEAGRHLLSKEDG